MVVSARINAAVSAPQEAEPELFSALIYTRNKLLFEVGKLFLGPPLEFLI